MNCECSLSRCFSKFTKKARAIDVPMQTCRCSCHSNQEPRIQRFRGLPKMARAQGQPFFYKWG